MRASLSVLLNNNPRDNSESQTTGKSNVTSKVTSKLLGDSFSLFGAKLVWRACQNIAGTDAQDGSGAWCVTVEVETDNKTHVC